MIEVKIDDLSSVEVCDLVAEHVAGMQGCSPACYSHALDLQKLKDPSITFWVARIEGILCGCGALKELHAASGEIKSMRTRSEFLRRGVGQAILDEIKQTALNRGYSKLFLETGTGETFEAAHKLYLRNGFEWCGPFGDYTATDFNVFMSKNLKV